MAKSSFRNFSPGSASPIFGGLEMINLSSFEALEAYAVLMPLAPWEKPKILTEALESLEAQTWPPAQVVVSCDGEPPSGLHDALQLSDLPLQILVGPGSEGVGPVLARGLIHCHEELVMRMDADDWSEPHRAAVQIRWMMNNPQVKALGTQINEFEISPDSPLMRRWVPLKPEDISRVSKIRNPMNHPSIVFRKSPILAVGNYRSVPGFEDYELWLRLLCRGFELRNVEMPLVMARVGQAHLSRRRGWLYAIKECRFLIFCWRCNYFSTGRMLLLLFLRVPMRLLPAPLLARLMLHGMRS